MVELVKKFQQFTKSTVLKAAGKVSGAGDASIREIEQVIKREEKGNHGHDIYVFKEEKIVNVLSMSSLVEYAGYNPLKNEVPQNVPASTIVKAAKDAAAQLGFDIDRIVLPMMGIEGDADVQINLYAYVDGVFATIAYGDANAEPLFMYSDGKSITQITA